MVGTTKRACHFSRSDGAPFAFAGLWDVWADEKQKIVTSCMITTTPNELVQPFHDRIPVILLRESYAEWLDPETPVARLLSLLKPHLADVMRAREVGPAANSPKNDWPECVQAS